MGSGDKVGKGPGRGLSALGCLSILLVAIPIYLLVTVLLGNWHPHQRAYEAEVKANLHNIQLSVERYAVDNDGRYPEYLIGGEAKYASDIAANTELGGLSVSSVEAVPDVQLISDPLLRAGYLDAYPRNPFAREKEQSQFAELQRGADERFPDVDPLRNGL